MSAPLVLSLFPGIGLLDRAFEEEGFCVVRGPDLLWGGDIKRFRVPAGRFDGVIGGVPCQHWSPLVHMVRHAHGEAAIAEDMFPEFQRVVAEAQPEWFLTECSPFAPIPSVVGYAVTDCVLDNRWLGEGIGQVQRRRRRFCFGVCQVGAHVLDASPDLACLEAPLTERTVTTKEKSEEATQRLASHNRQARRLDVSPDLALFEAAEQERAVIATGAKEGSIVKLDKGGRERPYEKRRTLPDQQQRRSVARCLELQGFPPDMLDDAPFTQEAKYTVIGNGVPLPMGRAVARAVKRAMGYALEAAS